MADQQPIYETELHLTAAEVTPQHEMPAARMLTLLIDTATEHANLLNAGFKHLSQFGASWVLSRVSIDFKEPLNVGHTYRISTWVSSLNRLYSERCFEFRDVATNEVTAWAHTVWMAIDIKSRRPADLTVVTPLGDVVIDRDFLGSTQSRLMPLQVTPEVEQTREFLLSDIDVNRHVTTRSYVERIIDLFDLELLDRKFISGLALAFKQECLYRQTGTAEMAPSESPDAFDTQIRVADKVCILAQVRFADRSGSV